MRPTKTRKFVRVSEKRAHELFNEGVERLYICACKMDPDVRGFAERISKESDRDSFETCATDYAARKCSHKTGNYPAYFVPLKGTK